jgi:hypothetical protein
MLHRLIVETSDRDKLNGDGAIAAGSQPLEQIISTRRERAMRDGQRTGDTETRDGVFATAPVDTRDTGSIPP